MILNLDSKLKKAPLFICGCPKSGTTLLRALFDGHPELLISPMEMKFFRYTDYPTVFPEKKLSQASDLKEIMCTMLESRYFKILLRKEALTFAGNEKPPDYDVDPAKFEACFADLSQVKELRDLFLHFFEALLVGTDRQINDLLRYKIVNKTPFQEEYAIFLKQWFPNAQFIHLVRNPYANLVSLRKREEKVQNSPSYPYLRQILSWMTRSDYFRERNQRLMGTETYLVLRYEDLIQAPEQTMRQICSFAKIDFQDSLLQPTQIGQPWQGNSMFKQRFTGIDASPLARWKDDITDFEVALINKKLKNLFDALDYPMIASTSKMEEYPPQPHEGVQTYIQNRLFLKEE